MQGRKKMGKLLESGKIWPYAIGGSILFIFSACMATIYVATTLPVEKSDTYMMQYQVADAKANDLIKAKIAFDKEYKIEYINNGINVDNTTLQYKISDLSGNGIDNAEIKLIITRPNNHKNNQEFFSKDAKDGVYTFSGITLPIEGRWNIMVKVNVDELQSFYSLKADTRSKEVFEY